MTSAEATGVVQSVIHGLQGNPLVIGLLALNTIFIGVFYLGAKDASQVRHEELLAVMQQCNVATDVQQTARINNNLLQDIKNTLERITERQVRSGSQSMIERATKNDLERFQ